MKKNADYNAKSNCRCEKGLAELPADDKQRLIFKISMDLLFQMLVGTTSQNYLRLYNEGLLDDSFGYEFSMDRSFYFADLAEIVKNRKN